MIWAFLEEDEAASVIAFYLLSLPKVFTLIVGLCVFLCMYLHIKYS